MFCSTQNIWEELFCWVARRGDATNGRDEENREDRENRGNRENREFKELRERLSLNSLNSLNSLISYFNQHTYFSSERCSSGADMKKVRMGCTKAYCSFGLLIEASLMRRYHEKFRRSIRSRSSALASSLSCGCGDCDTE